MKELEDCGEAHIYCSKYFDNSKQPFSLTVAGTKYYVVTNPDHTATFYNNNVGLSWDQFLNEVLLGFGVERSRLDRLWSLPGRTSSVNPSGKCLINLTEDLYIQHLLPGESFRRLAEKLEKNMINSMSLDSLSERFPSLKHEEDGVVRVSLKNLCSDVLIDVTQMCLFDPVLFKFDPEMTKDMQYFTDELWKLLYPAPGVDSTKVAALRARYIKAFRQYIKLPSSERREEAWLITTLIKQYKELQIDEHDAAAMLVMVYWA